MSPLRREALPQSWRPYTHDPVEGMADAVIVTDVQNPMRGQRTFEVWTYGVWVASRHRLDDAKAYLERIYGPLNWKRQTNPPKEMVHYYFGPTTEFTEPVTFYTADLPKLGAKAVTAGVTDSKQEWDAAASGGMRWVFHATTRDVYERMVSQGVRVSDVPMNLNRRRYQEYQEGRGTLDDIFFQPGAGVGMGTYVGGSVQAVAGFGRYIVAMLVPERALERPPEANGATDPIDWFLGNSLGMLLTEDVPPDRVVGIGRITRTPASHHPVDFIRDAREASKTAGWGQERLFGVSPTLIGYHRTRVDNRQSIQQYGLQAGRSRGGRNHRVYLDTVRQDPTARMDTKPTDLWEVDYTNLSHRPDPELPDRWVIVEEDVSPGRLRLVATTEGGVARRLGERWTGRVPIQPGQSMYRGLSVTLPDREWQRFLDDWERGGDLSWLVRAVADYSGPRGQGIGKHWTTDHDTGRSFATGGFITPFGTGTGTFEGGHVGVVLEAEFSGGHMTDVEELQKAWRWESEQEVTISPGTRLTLRGLEVYGPRQMPDKEHWSLLTGDGVWRSYRTGMQVTAADYWGGHRPPEDGPPLYDLLEGDSWFPDDVYTSPHFYTFGGNEPFERESIKVVQATRGQPQAMVTIYRSLPPDADPTIGRGDWVTLSEAYARQHGMHATDPAQDWPVVSARVPARTVRNGGNDIIEWGYWGPPVRGRLGAKMARQPKPGRLVLLDVDALVRTWHLHRIDRYKRDRLVEAIEAEGLRRPPYMSGAEGDRGLAIKLLDGNHRVAAVAELGWRQVPVWVEDTIPDDELRSQGLVRGGVQTMPMATYGDFPTPYRGELGRFAKVAGIEDTMPLHEAVEALEERYADLMGAGTRQAADALSGALDVLGSDRAYGLKEAERARRLLSSPPRGSQSDDDAAIRRFLMALSRTIERLAGAYPSSRVPRYFTDELRRAWTAMEALLPRHAAGGTRWYHGTNHAFTPGDHVGPGDQHGVNHPGRNDRVWVSNNAWIASRYGSRTFEVIPDDEPRPHGNSALAQDEFHCSGAAVVREISNQEILDASNQWYRDRHPLASRTAAQRVMYHLSATHNRDSIRQHGLWLPDFGTKLIWLFTSPEDAAPYMGKSFGGSRGNNDLWAVDVTGLTVLDDPHAGWEGLSTYAVAEPIGPERLELVDTNRTASVADDPQRWQQRQQQWDGGAYPSVQERVVSGGYILHLGPLLRDPEGDVRYIHALTADGEYVGQTFVGFPTSSSPTIEGAPEVKPEHRRKGLASAMYQWAEEVFGAKIAPADSHTNDAEGLWGQPNRTFGKTAIYNSPRHMPYLDRHMPEGYEVWIGGSESQPSYLDNPKTYFKWHVEAHHSTEGMIGWLDTQYVEGGFTSQGHGPDDVVIVDVTVFPDHRRKGVATGLLAALREHVRPLRVVHNTELSPAGRGWSRAVGKQAARAYYHGSDREFEPGDLIQPQSETGVPNWAEQMGLDTSVMGPHYSAEHVYLADNATTAMDFGDSVYEVEPLGPVVRDPEDMGTGWYRTQGAARVVRKVVYKNRPLAKRAARGDGDGWIEASDGNTYWGRYGAAGLLVVHTDEDGTARFFLQQRAAWVDEGGTWGIPGGALDSDESPQQGAVREFTEETGVPGHRLGAVIDQWSFEPADDWSYTTVVVEAADQFDSHYNAEQSGTGWFTYGEMQAMRLHPGLRDSLPKIRRHGHHAAERPKAKVLV